MLNKKLVFLACAFVLSLFVLAVIDSASTFEETDGSNAQKLLSFDKSVGVALTVDRTNAHLDGKGVGRINFDITALSIDKATPFKINLWLECANPCTEPAKSIGTYAPFPSLETSIPRSVILIVDGRDLSPWFNKIRLEIAPLIEGRMPNSTRILVSPAQLKFDTK